ncbi:hypothetical protein ACFL6S_35000 [Candidatus Poribacteria bacterium]
MAGYVSLAQWTFWSFGRKRTLTTLVFALTLCYTGLRAKVCYPCAQAMAEFYETRYQQKTDSFQKKHVAVHRDSLSFAMGDPATESISHADAQRNSTSPQSQGTA